MKKPNEGNKFVNVLMHDIRTPVLAQIQSLEFIINSEADNLDDIQKEILVQILNLFII